MAAITGRKGAFSVAAYPGDAKTLLAFNLDKMGTKNLAGFTLRCEPDGQPHYYIHNQLQFEAPGNHAQDPKEPPTSSMNAPIHKFRWIHVPGSIHQGLKPFFGKYTYTVTPRYFDARGSMLPLEKAKSVAVHIDVVPFQKGTLKLGFTRGFTQSQAFVHHFGKAARISPKGADLLFDTSQHAGANAEGETYTYSQEYEWLGFTARELILEMLEDVRTHQSYRMDAFAYDLREPDIMKALIELAGQGRVRVILDNAALHHDAQGSKPEDMFEQEFSRAKQGRAAILRGKFGRYSHDKVFVVSDGDAPIRVLTGSANFSVTGLYVNSNHVLVFDDAGVAKKYSEVFNEAWSDKADKASFQGSALSGQSFTFSTPAVPKTDITFSPHSKGYAAEVLDAVAKRIEAEGAKKSGGSVLFAVMEIDNGTSPVYRVLNDLHADQSIFSFGISDSPEGIVLYKPGKKTGVLVSGKPASTVLPPPFDQVPGMGMVHQVHHKFVVCGFKDPDAVVYCGSSNLASGGEEANGDNLLAVHDTDVATAFAIEALGLVDHFNFLDRYATRGKGKGGKSGTPPSRPAVSPGHAAASAGWFLSTEDAWTKPYFDPDDLKSADRELFG